MSKLYNKISFIRIIGTFIVVIFFFVLALNVLPSKNKSNNNGLSTNSVIPNDNIDFNKDKVNNSKIISMSIENNKLKIIFDNQVNKYCVKTTKTKPSLNNICWKKIDNNITYTSIYKYKKYYIWTIDDYGNISDYISIYSNLQ